MSKDEAKIKEPMETWAKVFIALSVIIILGANIALSAITAYNEVQCSKKPSDPYHIDAVYEEISYVTDNNGDTYAIGVDYYEKVDTNTQEKNEFLDDAETAATAVGAVELLLFIPNVLAIVLSVNLYKAIKKNRNGEKATANIVGVIVCAGILVGGGIFAAVAIESYVEKAQEAHQSVAVHAPVIYLYTEEETPVNVQLDLNGEFTFTYPRYIENRGWNVTASPSGTLTDNIGNKYDFLFWQADMYFDYDLSHGYCVPGSQTEEFLYEAAYELGLNDKEAAAFVGYWIPYMRDNEYNVITFQTECFDEAAELHVSPEPDVVLRVNMLWYASDEYVEIEAQNLSAIGLPLSGRHGFTLVEWGGEFLE